MDDIRNIARPTDVPDYGLLNDLLWSDPADMEADWEANERGVSYCFGKKVIMEFLQKHDFDLVCRAHMVVEDGYEFFNERILVTVFSAPNYCGEFDNWGAVMSVSGELLCSFELLKPLDSSALKSHIKKGRNKRESMLNSPVSLERGSCLGDAWANTLIACKSVPTKLLISTALCTRSNAILLWSSSGARQIASRVHVHFVTIDRGLKESKSQPKCPR